MISGSFVRAFSRCIFLIYLYSFFISLSLLLLLVLSSLPSFKFFDYTQSIVAFILFVRLFMSCLCTLYKIQGSVLKVSLTKKLLSYDPGVREPQEADKLR